jgi:hypothetical protein
LAALVRPSHLCIDSDLRLFDSAVGWQDRLDCCGCCIAALHCVDWILIRGEVQVLGVDNEILNEEKAGTVIGELAAVDPGPRSATVIAGRSGAVTLQLNAPAFREAITENPDTALSLLRTLGRRLRKLKE